VACLLLVSISLSATAQEEKPEMAEDALIRTIRTMLKLDKDKNGSFEKRESRNDLV